jgi:hypothetical protein
MTAINVVCQKQRNCIHVVSDAASYNPDGIIGGFVTKTFTVPHWPGVLAVRGTGSAGPRIGYLLSLNFGSFDALIDGIEAMLPSIVAAIEIPSPVEIIIAGFSERGPESYVIETSAETPIGVSDEAFAAMVADGSGYCPEPYVLQRLPAITAGPPPHDEVIMAAQFHGFKEDDDPEIVIAGLRKVVEMQRQSLFDGGIYWVGGFAQLTTIRPDGIEQRILQHWPEDRVGQLIRPTPIDWAQWHRDNPKPVRGGASVFQLKNFQKVASNDSH